MKKVLAIILSTVLLISICPFGIFSVTASAATSGTTAEGLGYYTIGDLDEDEELTDWDGVMLARYLAGWSIEIPAIEVLDIDGDGEVTDWDGVMFDRQLAGWSVSTEAGKKLAFNITYLNTKGATNINPNSLQYGNAETNLLEISAPHYTFDGWYVGNLEYTSIPANQNGDLALTAKWTPIEYDITYTNTKGATNNNPTSFNIESSTITLSNINAEGYAFDGWYNDGTRITSIPSGSSGNIVLSAKWTPCDYSITYNNTKGAVNNNVTGFNTDSETITLSDLQKEGYTFNGWYKDGVKVTEITKGTIGNIVLTANWTKIEYSITYLNVNGATNNNPSSYTIESNNISLMDLSLSNYIFLGWFDENGQVTTIPKGSTSDIVLTAKWESLYNIIYTNTKSATNKNPTSYTANDGIIELLDLTKTGYTFNGWYEGDTKITHIDSNEKRDITLVASWTPKTYTISFNGNGGTSNKSVVATYGQAMPEIKDIPFRRGFEFLGYYSSDGYKYYNADLSSARNWTLTKNSILYAKWADLDYQVVTQKSEYSTKYNELQNYSEYYFTAEETGMHYLQVDDSNTYCTGKYNYGAEWTFAHYTMVLIYDKDGIEYNIATVKGVDSGKTYYDYDRPYFYNAAHTIKENDGFLLAMSGDSFVFTGSTDSIFEIEVPVVKGNTYKIIAYNVMIYLKDLVMSGASYPVSTHKDECPQNNTKYRVLTEDGKLVDVYAKDEIRQITFTNTNGAENFNSIYFVQNREYVLLDPVKAGYNFEGWYLNGEKITILSNITSDITLEARWSLIEYTATFYIDDQIVGTTTFNVENYAITDFPALPHKKHYTSSWDYQMALEDISVYAKYTPIEYIITYKNIGNSTNHNPTTYNIENGALLSRLSRPGCDFVGWMNEDGDMITSIPVGSFGDITLTAVWYNYTDYTIEFVDDTYGLIVDDIIYNVDSETITLPQLTDQTDYYFAGWYSGDTKYTTIPKYSTGNLKLTARWASKDISFAGSASVYNISMSGGSAYVQSVSVSKSWDSSRKAWLVGVTVKVRINPRTSATYEVRLGTLDFGTVSFQGYESYETQTRTTTMYLSPGNY